MVTTSPSSRLLDLVVVVVVVVFKLIVSHNDINRQQNELGVAILIQKTSDMC